MTIFSDPVGADAADHVAPASVVASQERVLQAPAAVDRNQFRVDVTPPETATLTVVAPPPAFVIFPENVVADVGENMT